MARMIPSDGPREFTPASQEGAIYAALSTLDDNFVVVHSASLLTIAGADMKEAEADFLLFHKDIGLIVFESKAGQVRYENGDWLYSSGKRMKHGGPFNQARRTMYSLIDKSYEVGIGKVMSRCRTYTAVWFPSVSGEKVDRINLPPECLRDLILTKDDLADPSVAIAKIAAIAPAGKAQDISEKEANLIIEKLLCPHFCIEPVARTRYDYEDIAFVRLLEAQSRVLDFMQDQKFAVISGAAGTGKTLIAITHAKRAADRNERVLFLCYNRLLCEDVRARCADYDLIDVYTIDALSTKYCGAINYEELVDSILSAGWQYDHVVVDEGQDFGDCGSVFDAIKLLMEQKESGSFYVFYDKNQLIQGSGLSDFIRDADCKMTLYVNCRNTHNIAKSSMKSLNGEGDCRVIEGAPQGTVPRLFCSLKGEEQEDAIDGFIAELRELGLNDVVILTCATEESSVVGSCVNKRKGESFWKDTKVPFSTCRKFKGLEADAVILVDVTSDLWIEDAGDGQELGKPGLIFYTGSSRAKHELRVVCDMDETDFQSVCDVVNVGTKKGAEKAFSKWINAIPVGR